MSACCLGLTDCRQEILPCLAKSGWSTKGQHGENFYLDHYKFTKLFHRIKRCMRDFLHGLVLYLPIFVPSTKIKLFLSCFVRNKWDLLHLYIDFSVFSFHEIGTYCCEGKKKRKIHTIAGASSTSNATLWTPHVRYDSKIEWNTPCLDLRIYAVTISPEIQNQIKIQQTQAPATWVRSRHSVSKSPCLAEVGTYIVKQW